MRDHSVGTGRVRSLLVLIGLVGGPLGHPAVAQYTHPGSAETLNYAFASQLGSGIYQLAGHTVQIYRIPFQFPVPRDDDGSPVVRVNLPVCFGFFELSPAEEGQPDRPDGFATASFVPGVAVEIALRENWSLEPFAEVGLAENFHDHERAYVYAIGVKSLEDFHLGGIELLLGQRLVYVGESVQGTDLDEDFAALETGVEVRHPLPLGVKGHELDGGLYVMDFLFIEPTKVFLESKPVEVGNQIELGITLGTRMPVPIWRFEFPRLGLGYRFGDGVSALRLVLGAAF